jgi:flavin reductase (DIM6/NTAB) family NADH-FMN oxidoreductase RutF
MKYDLDEILKWEKKYRIRFINSISGYKSVHLVGTRDTQGRTNVAIFNSIVHLGASPPLIGLIVRPITEDRHTYFNLLETGQCTINHVHKSFLKQAHYTSANFLKDESEFEKCGLTEEYLDGFSAPFVAESKIKFGLKIKENITIQKNGTHLIVGELQHVLVDEEAIGPDGQLDLESAHDVCITGLNQYSSVSKFKNLPQARVEDLPNFKSKERADNVVYDSHSQTYNANILPYGTSIGSPRIVETGVSHWKNSSIASFNHIFADKIESLKKDYQRLIDEYNVNEMLYQSKMNFEPIVGQVYHLYVDKNNDQKFLSLISPSDWKMECVGSFKLNHEKIWQKI